MIRLSKLADYGIVMMTHLARMRSVPGDQAQCSAQAIAAATSIAPPMASKILKLLGRSDLLRSQRGAHGGYELARSAAEITVADIIEALEGPIALTECIEDAEGDCCIEALCPTRTNWQRINAAIREALAGISLDEMAHAVPEAFLFESERRGGELNLERS